MTGDICRSMSSSKICTESVVYYKELYSSAGKTYRRVACGDLILSTTGSRAKLDLSSFQKHTTMLSNMEMGSHKETCGNPLEFKI